MCLNFSVFFSTLLAIFHVINKKILSPRLLITIFSTLRVFSGLIVYLGLKSKSFNATSKIFWPYCESLSDKKKPGYTCAHVCLVHTNLFVCLSNFSTKIDLTFSPSPQFRKKSDKISNYFRFKTGHLLVVIHEI